MKVYVERPFPMPDRSEKALYECSVVSRRQGGGGGADGTVDVKLLYSDEVLTAVEKSHFLETDESAESLLQRYKHVVACIGQDESHVSVGNSNSASLYYDPKPDPSDSVITIDGEATDMPIHRLTRSKQHGCTPRYKCTGAHTEKLHPLPINPDLGDIVHIQIGTGKKITVMFCKADSKHPSVKAIHSLSTTKQWRDRMERYFLDGVAECTENRHVDDLGGGVYLPFGMGVIPPGPKHGNRRLNGRQVPFLRHTATSRRVREIRRLTGDLQATVATAIRTIRPDAVEENRVLGRDADDCMLHHGNRSDACGHWYNNQAILRAVGRPIADRSRDDNEIALHYDASDYPSLQPLTFIPYGGEDNLGGEVDGSDLLVFETTKGGKSCRVKTSLHDSLVVVLMDSCTQLHGGAIVDEPDTHGGCWSLRYIPYVRRGIVDFTDERRKVGKRAHGGGLLPRATVKIKEEKYFRVLPRHWTDGLKVRAPFGKDRKFYWAHLKLEPKQKRQKRAPDDPDGAVRSLYDASLVWADGRRTPNDWQPGELYSEEDVLTTLHNHPPVIPTHSPARTVRTFRHSCCQVKHRRQHTTHDTQT